MAQYVTKVRTEHGDLQIDYNALANKPASLPANGGNADTVDGKHASYFASAADVEELQTSFNEVLNETINKTINEINVKINETSTQLNEVSTKIDSVSTEEINYISGVTGNVQEQLDGKASSSHEHSADDVTSGTLPIARGGIGSSDGATGLKNLFAAGGTVLSSNQYGTDFPTNNLTAGMLFLKKV